MITTLGFLMMLVIIGLILLRRISPVVAFTTLPVAACLLAGFNPGQIGEFIKAGLITVAPTAALFLFAILFFGIMRDRGLFDPLVNLLIRSTGGKPLAVALVTVLVTSVVHLDGVGAATFLLTIPALLPLYKRLNMSPAMLLCLVGTTAGVINMVPWGGTTARAAAVSGLDATELWLGLLPVQLVGLVCMLLVATVLGSRAQRRRPMSLGAAASVDLDSLSTEGREFGLSPRNLRYWLNVALTGAILACLFTGIFPLYACFMVGLGIALPLNFPSLDAQAERLKAHASDALQMVLVMMAAAVLLGVLSGAKMSDGMALALIDFLPGGSAQYLHVIVGFFGVPLGMIFSPDAYYFALLPVIRDVAAAAGVPLEAVARAMLIGENTGFSISPVVPSVYLALALSGVELRKHMAYTFFWAWGVSLVMLAFAVATGAVQV
ncbi:citrate transporter [Pseudomonas sp. Fig-3]|jgi:CitMHS family citrate-Mg2+:H+ or citrate-Ca2+:H+ symporter|uniref:Citrate transporter n=1 Tax=Pseudomonas rhizophila TaxID=2045200 RepID=A0ABN5JZS8_9PSED|nr:MULTISPECIES: citrate:proton symporter [Pseudomonas]AVU76821.1 citrate transporter [Pseudomonas rhizophila]MDR8384205.1 citrate:proton symporter [Pseudomonas sp. JL2]MXR30266.1 citrate transporter [Pseudomonas sp. PICF6]TNB83372.1 citrate transporter [Pseudomonas sp. Fig-3]SIR99967.1 citrate-Mg2+:H+ or citrate-Ca2+:H+ symporter, CitMHS family [Pseudomonas sp. A214]